ncbi:protein of unknown function [Bradyrhizobium vignae]|uniref:Uncharacterized protein n=1 Tax=Bradyrhizobium vignae TaxID=1549949 RepID=A0A2U3PQ96_9BRAD|nr:protein of unknown function [Bradyrhizobium vignae]
MRRSNPDYRRGNSLDLLRCARNDGEEARSSRYTPAVVPAQAGTHNPREGFGEDWLFDTAIARTRWITRYGSRPAPGRRWGYAAIPRSRAR